METEQEKQSQALQYLPPGARAHLTAFEKPTAKEQQLIDRLFVRLNSIYGHLWASRFRSANILDAAKLEWLNALRNYTPEDIALALVECKPCHPESPPTMFQFEALCRKARKYRESIKQQPPQPWNPNRELAAKQIQEARENLKNAVMQNSLKRTA